MNEQQGGFYGTWNSLAVMLSVAEPLAATKTVNSFGETYMQTDIEILESRENPSVLWF
jgi:hypothetical protein